MTRPMQQLHPIHASGLLKPGLKLYIPPFSALCKIWMNVTRMETWSMWNFRTLITEPLLTETLLTEPLLTEPLLT